ncbi:PIG-L family deacetylase [Lutibacter sp.]|uniref:PIG-L family deacetylase n=1 Tax=Lutibacter sp. TaxID=1925666 RepID=UPI00273461D6|nr:PIG-L family deacetylase [Lutibacter sp.]MDP3314049.1 PIG-L family deacetylase [Lutibacter sp.]
MKRRIAFTLLFTFFLNFNFAQAPKKPTAGEIYDAIEKLNFLGSVLYIAAHPDDENTRLISYFANDVKARTAYLSITRGDGGQNLIGPEISEFLGVIRTQELLAARKKDGGEQFFTRANDFGYSKHPDETLKIWSKNEVLSDVVTVIRKFKPDVIVNRFNHSTAGSTHGHHTASAMLSLEAFDLAGDKNYKTLLKNESIWKPKRLFFNTSWWFYGSQENFDKADKTNLLELEIGTFYKQKGLSNGEIASLSRSQHQSQGFGSTGSRGSETEYLEFLKGEFPINKNPFYGIDTTWNRVDGGNAIGVLLQQVQKEFNFLNPSASIPKLVKAYSLIENLKDEHWKKIKLEEIKNIIAACTGLYLEVVADNSSTTINSTNLLKIEAINRSDVPINLKGFSVYPFILEDRNDVLLKNNESYKTSIETTIPNNAKKTAPYWLIEKGTIGMYNVRDSELIGLAETPKQMSVNFIIEILATQIPFTKEVIYKYNDPVKGEIYKPFEVLPQISASFNEEVYIFADNSAQIVKVKLKALKDNIQGLISLKIPTNWKISPTSISFELTKKGEEKWVDFLMTPTTMKSEGIIKPEVSIGLEKFSNKLVEINYEHIPFQSVVMPSEAKIVRLNIRRKGQLIGYIQGAGDAVPTSLRQIGYTVVELNEDEITPEKIANFDAIIVGIRTYNTSDKATFYQKHLHNFVANGGNLIVQYHTNSRLKVDALAPYSLKLSRDRVTEEDSEVILNNPSHEILNVPNKISITDFEGWVQERGLYFPDEWDANFESVLTLNDQGESEKRGSLLVAKYGKGYYIYTGLSFFRELPAGVSGAYRLFANMISIGKNNNEKLLKN